MMKTNGLRGLYVVFDGIIGCGKSTQIKELKKHLSADFPKVDFYFTYEPGGNSEADEIRKRLKFERMSSEKEMRLFAKSRSITLPQVVGPALTEGKVVISDRSFTTSLSYQAFGRKLGLSRVWRANESSVDGIFPDILFFMNVGLESCLKRSGGDDPDKFDKEDINFWKTTIDGYEKMIDFLTTITPETKILRIDDPKGELNIEETRLAVKDKLYPFIESFDNEGRIIKERQVV